MGRTRSTSMQADWVSKTLAGVLLGFTFALAGSGMFAQLASGVVMGARVQLAMWMFVPIWLGVLSFVYLFENGRRAWIWLGALNLLVFAILAIVRWR